jgi:hypothetical protein
MGRFLPRTAETVWHALLIAMQYAIQVHSVAVIKATLSIHMLASLTMDVAPLTKRIIGHPQRMPNGADILQLLAVKIGTLGLFAATVTSLMRTAEHCVMRMQPQSPTG